MFIGNGSGYEKRALDTSDVAEDSSNLYYTDARFNTAFTAKDTDDLSEGTTTSITRMREQEHLFQHRVRCFV